MSTEVDLKAKEQGIIETTSQNGCQPCHQQ